MKKLIYTFILTFIFIGTLTAGGPWPQLKGNAFFKLSEWWVVFNQHYTDSGLIDPNVTTGVFNTSLYAEYGFTDRFTGILNANLFSRNYINNLLSQTTGEVLVKGEGINSLGDIDIGLKYGLNEQGSKIPISATLVLGIPTGKAVAGTLNNLQTGDGEFNQMLQIDAGMGFKIKSTPAYISTYVGFNNRTKGFSEEFRFGLEYGVGFLNQKLWLIGKLIGVESLKNGDTVETTTSTSIFANNTEYASFALEANYYVTKRLGLSAGFAGAFRGEIIAASPSYSFGVFYDMSK